MTFDLFCLALIGLFALWGLIRGLLRQFLGFIGFVGGIVLARLFARSFADAFAADLHLPVFVAAALCALVIFLAVEITAKLIGGYLHRHMEGGFTGGVERIGGFLIGAAKGVLVVWALASLVALVRPHLRHVERDTPAKKLEISDSRAIRWSTDTNLITELGHSDADELKRRIK